MATYTMTEAQADALLAKTGTLFKGRFVQRDSATEISYTGSRADQRAFEDVVASVKRAAPVATPVELATPRQISYLRNLIQSENGQLSGVSVQNWDGLTKADASRAINIILNWA